MMIDASAIVAILADEPGARELGARLDAARTRMTTPLAVFEATLAIARLAAPAPDERPAMIERAREIVSEFLALNGIRTISISPDIGAAALVAASRFGKAVGHPADLNFGDCFAYAAATVFRAPLLFKGEDFTKTDVRQA
jgi:ribonuclease VapC